MRAAPDRLQRAERTSRDMRSSSLPAPRSPELPVLGPEHLAVPRGARENLVAAQMTLLDQDPRRTPQQTLGLLWDRPPPQGRRSSEEWRPRASRQNEPQSTAQSIARSLESRMRLQEQR